MSTVIPDVTARLTSWLQPLLGEDVRVEGLDRVDFGHSAEMLVFTIATSTDHTDVVLRLRPDPPALLEPYDLPPRQFRVLSALRDTAVRTPKSVVARGLRRRVGPPVFFVMERVPGGRLRDGSARRPGRHRSPHPADVCQHG